MALVSPSRFNSYMNRRGEVASGFGGGLRPLPRGGEGGLAVGPGVRTPARGARVEGDVAVVEAGDRAAAAGCVARGVRAGEFDHLRVVPDRREAAPAHRGRPGFGVRRGQGGDLAVVDDEVCRVHRTLLAV